MFGHCRGRGLRPLPLAFVKGVPMYGQRRAAKDSAALIAGLRVSVVGALLLSAGCAAKLDQPSGVAGPVASADPSHWRTEIETGWPAQLAPSLRPTISDDPTEPWSPSYGSRVPQPSGGSVPTLPAAPAAVPTPNRPPAKLRPARAAAPQVPSAASDIAMLDADEVIRRAIADHEMRRRE